MISISKAIKNTIIVYLKLKYNVLILFFLLALLLERHFNKKANKRGISLVGGSKVPFVVVVVTVLLNKSLLSF